MFVHVWKLYHISIICILYDVEKVLKHMIIRNMTCCSSFWDCTTSVHPWKNAKKHFSSTHTTASSYVHASSSMRLKELSRLSAAWLAFCKTCSSGYGHSYWLNGVNQCMFFLFRVFGFRPFRIGSYTIDSLISLPVPVQWFLMVNGGGYIKKIHKQIKATWRILKAIMVKPIWVFWSHHTISNCIDQSRTYKKTIETNKGNTLFLC